MATTEYRNVEDVYVTARRVRDALLAIGQKQAADELEETMKTFWATASEAVGEIRLSLLKVRPIVEKIMDKDMLVLLDNAVSGAAKLFCSGG